MKRLLLAIFILVATFSANVRADPSRTRVRGVPHIAGRDIERLILTGPIVLNRSLAGVPFTSTMMVRILPSTFIPVAEDEKGVFYQAVNGYRTIRGNSPTPGGLYVSKVQSGKIWAYVGDAQVGSKWGVEVDTLPLPQSALHSLHTGKAERKN